jgi:transcriptional regulator with XRE-family HTH domain
MVGCIRPCCKMLLARVGRPTAARWLASIPFFGRRLGLKQPSEKEDLRGYNAHQADVHQTYLSGVEGGKRNPSIAVSNRIATALGSDISLLFVSPGRAKRPTS